MASSLEIRERVGDAMVGGGAITGIISSLGFIVERYALEENQLNQSIQPFLVVAFSSLVTAALGLVINESPNAIKSARAAKDSFRKTVRDNVASARKRFGELRQRITI